MLLRLVPEPPLPTILFTLAFGNLPDGMPFPAAWTAQLQHILRDELEMPQCIHALDKAAWAACLLHEVTFSVAARRVSVVFMDGSCAEWPLEGEALISALKEVMDDVNESSVASDMEQRRAKAVQAAAQVQAAQERMPASPSPAPSTKGKHKKSRSLLMSLVASFCPSSHSPSLANMPLVPPPPLSPVELAPPPPEPPHSSRYLRRKARAGLVDVYRRYVLPALANESPVSLRGNSTEHGYILWNLHSILRRIEVRMHELGTALGSVPSSSSSVKSSRSSMNAKKLNTSPSMLPQSPVDEEEEVSSATGTAEGSSAESTETEASSTSVHTPTDVLSAYPLMSPAAEEDNVRVAKEGGIVTPVTPLVSASAPISAHPQQPSRSRLRSQRPTKRPSRPPSSQSHNHGASNTNPHQQAQQHEFAILHASTIRLRALITRTTSFAQAQADERSVILVQLEKKSRRRAWSCRQLMGGAEVNVGVREGLNLPTRGSGLRLSWTVIEEGVVAGSILAHDTRDKSPLAVPPFIVPSQARCVSFPRAESEEGDDFCSTGPQDTGELFGAGEESENEESDSEPFGQTYGKENLGDRMPYMRSQSSDDLPSLLSSLSTSSSSSSSASSSPSTSPPSDSHFEPHVFDDAELEDMELGRRSVPMPVHAPVPMDEYGERDVYQAPNPLYIEEFGVKVKQEPLGRGMGLKAHARRRVALVR